MPSVRIRLQINPQTSKRTVTIAYESDSDALPHEHEEEHRALVNKLFEGGLVKAGDTIVVEREQGGVAAEAPVEPHAEREGQKEGT